jgi:hypothetical protein
MDWIIHIEQQEAPTRRSKVIFGRRTRRANEAFKSTGDFAWPRTRDQFRISGELRPSLNFCRTLYPARSPSAILNSCRGPSNAGTSRNDLPIHFLALARSSNSRVPSSGSQRSTLSSSARNCGHIGLGRRLDADTGPTSSDSAGGEPAASLLQPEARSDAVHRSFFHKWWRSCALGAVLRRTTGDDWRGTPLRVTRFHLLWHRVRRVLRGERIGRPYEANRSEQRVSRVLHRSQSGGGQVLSRGRPRPWRDRQWRAGI